MDVDPQTVKDATPGVLGALGSVFWLKGPWWMRAGLVIPGSALAHYGFSDFARITGMSHGLSGLAVGLFGMIVIDRVIFWWQSIDLGPLIVEWLRKLLRLTP